MMLGVAVIPYRYPWPMTTTTRWSSRQKLSGKMDTKVHKQGKYNGLMEKWRISTHGNSFCGLSTILFSSSIILIAFFCMLFCALYTKIYSASLKFCDSRTLSELCLIHNYGSRLYFHLHVLLYTSHTVTR